MNLKEIQELMDKRNKIFKRGDWSDALKIDKILKLQGIHRDYDNHVWYFKR